MLVLLAGIGVGVHHVGISARADARRYERMTIVDVRRDGTAMLGAGQPVEGLVTRDRSRRVEIAQQTVERSVLEHHHDGVIEFAEGCATDMHARGAAVIADAAAEQRGAGGGGGHLEEVTT